MISKRGRKKISKDKTEVLLELGIVIERGCGQTGSKAYLPAFFQFLTDCIEIFSKCFFFQARLNGTIKSDLTLLHSAHFTLHIAHFALFFQLEIP